MLNFCVSPVGHDKVIDTGRATTSRRTFKAPSLQKVNKKGGPSENMGFTDEPFENFKRKKS